MEKTSSATIDEYDLSRVSKPFWDSKIRLYDLQNCPCGATQGTHKVGAMYVGAVDRGYWSIYCKRCLRHIDAPTEAEAVEKWNNA